MPKFHVICSDCEHKYYTDKDPIKDSDKMQCGKCGKRDIVLLNEWEKNHQDFFPDEAAKLKKILVMGEVSTKKRDFVLAGFNMTPGYQNWNGLFSLMTSVGISPNIAKTSCDMFFGSMQKEQLTQQSGSLAPQQQQQQQTPQPPVIILDQLGHPTTINPQPQVQGASPQPPIIFMPPQQQQQQTQGNRIIHRPMLRDNKVVRDENNAPIMETIIPPNMQQQQDPLEKILGSLQKFNVLGGKGTDNVTEIQKSVEQGFEKMSKGFGEKDKIDRLIDAIENKFGQPPAQNPEIAELKAKLDIVTEKLYDTKTENKISAMKAEFENKFKSLEHQQAATKLSDPQFQIQSQEKSLGHVTEFAKETGNIFAEKLAEVLVPMLEMQRTQLNAQTFTNLRAQELQLNLPEGTLTAALMPPAKTQNTKPGGLTKTMDKIKERTG